MCLLPNDCSLPKDCIFIGFYALVDDAKRLYCITDTLCHTLEESFPVRALAANFII